MVAKRRKPKSQNLPILSERDLSSIYEIKENSDLFERITTQFGIEIPKLYRRKIAWTLGLYAETVFVSHRDNHERVCSTDRIVHAMGQLLKELDYQRNFETSDARREGYELFVLESQGYHIESLFFTHDLSGAKQHEVDKMIGRQDETQSPFLQKTLLPFDTFEQIGDHNTLGERHGWLETTLREIVSKLSFEPQKKAGPKGKSEYRLWVVNEFANIYEACGGSIKVYNDSAQGKIKGEFVDFVKILVDSCPTQVRAYLGTGMADEILNWKKQGRPEATGIINIPLA